MPGRLVSGRPRALVGVVARASALTTSLKADLVPWFYWGKGAAPAYRTCGGSQRGPQVLRVTLTVGGVAHGQRDGSVGTRRLQRLVRSLSLLSPGSPGFTVCCIRTLLPLTGRVVSGSASALVLIGRDEAMAQAKAIFATVQVSHSVVVGIRVLDNDGRQVGRWDAWLPKPPSSQQR
jgi:hypothetical protein